LRAAAAAAAAVIYRTRESLLLGATFLVECAAAAQLPYYTQPKQHAAKANCKKTVRILFPNFSILFNSYS
jgi:hypothetical protein